MRELRNVIERALLLAGDRTIRVRDPPADLREGEVPARAVASPQTTTPTGGLSLKEMERRHIARVLAFTNWHQGRASQVLGISPKTLYRKIRAYALVRPD